MIRRAVEPRRLTGAEGALLIAAIVAGLYAVSFAGRALGRLTGFSFAPLIVWLAAGALALWVMRRYLRGYCYTVSDGVFYLERTYGTHSKIILQIPTGDILEIGEKNAMLAGGRKPYLWAVCARSDVPVKVMAFRADGATRLLEFQADPEILNALNA